MKVFLSYAHSDNEALGPFLSDLINSVSSMYKSRTGEDLDIFQDINSINTGDTWRDKIFSSIHESSVFIPIITASYLSSIACMAELSAFKSYFIRNPSHHSIAGIVPFYSSEVFESRLYDDNAAYLSRLQYIDAHSVWLDGVQSAEGRRLVARLVSDIISVEQSSAGNSINIHNFPQERLEPLVKSIDDGIIALNSINDNCQKSILKVNRAILRLKGASPKNSSYRNIAASIASAVEGCASDAIDLQAQASKINMDFRELLSLLVFLNEKGLDVNSQIDGLYGVVARVKCEDGDPFKAASTCADTARALTEVHMSLDPSAKKFRQFGIYLGSGQFICTSWRRRAH